MKKGIAFFVKVDSKSVELSHFVDEISCLSPILTFFSHYHVGREMGEKSNEPDSFPLHFP